MLQRFFRHMCMSAKVPAAVRLAKKALMEDKCVVIGLQSTGEARTEEAVTKYVGILIFFDALVQFCFYLYLVICFILFLLYLFVYLCFRRVLNLMILFRDLENCY